MDLAEMLAYCAKDFLDDRTDLVDGEGDNLWSDDYLVRQFNRAQRILARRAWVIIETGISTAARIVLSEGKVLYTLNKAVLHVFDATPSTQDYPIGRTEDINLRSDPLLGMDAFEIGEAAALAGASTTTGTPTGIASDAGSRTLRIYPPPAAAQEGVIVSLKIARMPLTYLTLDDTDASPEVPEEFHEEICEFAAGKALTLPNSDGEAKAEGRRLLQEFDRVVREARQERMRAEMGPSRWNFSSVTAVLQ